LYDQYCTSEREVPSESEREREKANG